MKPYVHRCIVQSGDLAGNKIETEVTPFHIEYKQSCENCREPLATVEQIAAYIYEELVE